jgi:hypothetical protein
MNVCVGAVTKAVLCCAVVLLCCLQECMVSRSGALLQLMRWVVSYHASPCPSMPCCVVLYCLQERVVTRAGPLLPLMRWVVPHHASPSCAVLCCAALLFCMLWLAAVFPAGVHGDACWGV